MIVPVFCVNADSHDKFHSPVFNKHELEYYLYIHIPVKISRYYELFQLDQLNPNYQSIKIPGFVHREPRKPWIRVITKALNTDIGLHTFRISMVNRLTNDVVSLYCGYIIQDDFPDRDYIYMTHTICDGKQEDINENSNNRV